nr:uncharacterized protein LOC105851718 isoform X2 [Cicer arietinum]
MLKLIESKFEFVPPINDLREMLKSELNEKWRQWKGDLKSMAYDPTKTKEEVASLVPDDRVDPNQYRSLAYHWFSDEGQKIVKLIGKIVLSLKMFIVWVQKVSQSLLMRR